MYFCVFCVWISFFISNHLIITASLFYFSTNVWSSFFVNDNDNTKADTILTILQVDICVFVFDIMFCNGQR